MMEVGDWETLKTRGLLTFEGRKEMAIEIL